MDLKESRHLIGAWKGEQDRNPGEEGTAFSKAWGLPFVVCCVTHSGWSGAQARRAALGGE